MIKRYKQGELIVFEQINGYYGSYYGKCCIVLHVSNSINEVYRQYIVLTSFGEKKDIDDLTISFLMMK